MKWTHGWPDLLVEVFQDIPFLTSLWWGWRVGEWEIITLYTAHCYAVPLPSLWKGRPIPNWMCEPHEWAQNEMCSIAAFLLSVHHFWQKMKDCKWTASTRQWTTLVLTNAKGCWKAASTILLKGDSRIKPTGGSPEENIVNLDSRIKPTGGLPEENIQNT